MWGPDPPTAKAISLRFYALKALAREHAATDIGERVGSKKMGGLVTPTSSPKSIPKVQAKRAMSDEPEEIHERPPKRRAAQVVRSYNESVGVTAAIDSEDESDVEWKPRGEVVADDVEGKNGTEPKDVTVKAEKEDIGSVEQKDPLLKAEKKGLTVFDKCGLGAPFAVIIHTRKRTCFI